MKVKRIITTIEVEDNNSTTSVELTKLFLDEHYVPLVATNISSNGNSTDINKLYRAVDNNRNLIVLKLAGIAKDINDALDEGNVRGESPIEPDGTSKTS